MSRVLSYTKTTTTVDNLDGEATLYPVLRCNPNKGLAVRLLSGSFSSYIVNVFNYGGVNTGLFKMSNDQGSTWTTVQLTDGVYTVNGICLAIQKKMAELDWDNDIADPTFYIRYNSFTFQTYCEIDSTKLKGYDPLTHGFQIDFKPTGSSMDILTGFVTPSLVDSDGTTTADQVAQMDWFGNSVSVEVDINGSPLSIVNGSSSYELIKVPLSVNTVNNEYTFPIAGYISPWISISSADSIKKFTVKLKGSRSGRQLLVLPDGQINLSLAIKQYDKNALDW